MLSVIQNHKREKSLKFTEIKGKARGRGYKRLNRKIKESIQTRIIINKLVLSSLREVNSKMEDGEKKFID